MVRTRSTYGTVFFLSFFLSRNALRLLVGTLQGNAYLGRPRRRWEDNIKMDFREVVVMLEAG